MWTIVMGRKIYRKETGEMTSAFMYYLRSNITCSKGLPKRSRQLYAHAQGITAIFMILLELAKKEKKKERMKKNKKNRSSEMEVKEYCILQREN